MPHHPSFSKQPGPGQKLCDVCGKATRRGSSALLSTTQVLGNEAYWRVVAQNIEKTTGHATEEMVLGQLQAAAKDTAAWLVCEECGDAMRGMVGLARAPVPPLGQLSTDAWNKGWEAANKWWDSGARQTPVMGRYRPNPGLGTRDVLSDYPNGLIATRLHLASEPKPRSVPRRKAKPASKAGCVVVLAFLGASVSIPGLWWLIG